MNYKTHTNRSISYTGCMVYSFKNTVEPLDTNEKIHFSCGQVFTTAARIVVESRLTCGCRCSYISMLTFLLENSFTQHAHYMRSMLICCIDLICLVMGTIFSFRFLPFNTIVDTVCISW